MRRVVTYGAERIDYTVVSNQRLTSKVRIHVHPTGKVEVEAPTERPLPEVDAAVRKRGRWIVRQLSAIADAHRHALPREYLSGETHFYLGRRYQLKVIEDREALSGVVFQRGRLQVSVRQADPTTIRRLLNAWYTERAKVFFHRRLAELSEEIRWLEKPPPLKLLKMQKQWGSCAPNGAVHLNPCLIRAPRECIDYVIVHELCHLREHNHSKRYYTLLAKHCSGWRETKQKLDGMAELLLAE